jgi:hypothetical protein
MMKHLFFAATAVAAVLMSGCATPDAAKLQSENKRLTSDLAQTQERAASLDKQLAYLSDVNGALKREKNARVTETTGVRSETRAFVHDQAKSIGEFAKSKERLDYVGGELIERGYLEGENLVLADFLQPLDLAITVIGGRAFTRGPTKIAFCLLRPQGDTLVTVWISRLYDVKQAGLFEVVFDAPFTPQKGDVIGLYSPGAVQLPYDRGTGDTRLARGPVELGRALDKAKFDAGGERSYSFGVIGFID